MQLRVLASGSAGNCYIMENENEALIIELGLQFEVIKKALNFNLNKVVGALVTHCHGDHAKGVQKALSAGIDVYTSKGCTTDLNIIHHRIKHVSHLVPQQIGNFTVFAFDVHHDVTEPLGFLIKHPDCGLTCFITDSSYCDYNFDNLENVIIEANYSDEIIDEHLRNGTLQGFRHDRTIKEHMSIATCKKFLLQNNLTRVRNILLIHLSDKNSHAANFQKEIEDCTGLNVRTAKKGLILSLDSPF